MKDYVGLARQYEADVVAGRVPACKWVRLACARNQRDLARAAANDPDFPFAFNPELAVRICTFAELLPHTKGPKAKIVGRDARGRAMWNTIELEPWQCWFFTTLFGWVKRASGLRRFRVALMLVPRKNAKSTMAAIVVLYMLTADGESGAECYSAATTRDQAKTIAEIAWEMVFRSPAFREYYGVRLGARTSFALSVPATGSKFLPLSADAHTLDSLNVSLAAIDELHAHTTRAVWDVLDTATGARLQPLILPTTTAGVLLNGICFQQVEYLRGILEGRHADESYFGVEYTADEGDDWRAPATWRKANPNFGVSVQDDDLERKARQAHQSQDGIANFQTKHLNVWVTSASPCLSSEGWQAGQSDWAEADLEREACFVGVDLASKLDLCALSFLFPPTPSRPRWRVIQRIWTPDDTIEEREDRDPGAEYRKWERAGWLIAPLGKSLDHDLVRQAILWGRDHFDIRLVGFDPWHASAITKDLVKLDGFREEQILEVPQTFPGMSAACLRLQAEILEGKIDARRCPVTAWSVSNVVGNRDGKGNLMFTKDPRKLRGRIDPVISMTIALALYLKQPDAAPKEYRMLVLGG